MVDGQLPSFGNNDDASCSGTPEQLCGLGIELLRAVFGRVYVAQNLRSLSTKTIRYFVPPDTCQYFPLCDDFGPMNWSSVFHFIEALERDLSEYSSHKLIYKVDAGRRALANAIFLLGAFMMIKLGKTADEVSLSFRWVDSKLIENFRDATYSSPNFELTLLDCWRGLGQALLLGWIHSTPIKDPTCYTDHVNLPMYEHFDNPLNGDLHLVVPGKFVAFKGPRELSDGRRYKDDGGFRHFSAEFYADIFRQLGVTDVVRLNEAEYDTKGFTSRGLVFHDLPFDDCTAPPERVVRSFLRIAASARGLVAVHCKAGLGRTGTLIALHMMQALDFGARDAMAWLRIMRPGSVIGPQQRFLCHADAAVTAAAVTAPAAPAAPAAPIAGSRPITARTRADAVAAPAGRGDPGSKSAHGCDDPAAAPAAHGVPRVVRSAASAVLAAQVQSGLARRGTVRAGAFSRSLSAPAASSPPPNVDPPLPGPGGPGSRAEPSGVALPRLPQLPSLSGPRGCLMPLPPPVRPGKA